MIKKTIFFSIFLLGCWSSIVMYKPFSVSQHQWQDNVICAEKFMFDIDSIDNLIVGTSLSKKLQVNNLTNFYNLSFGGQSVFDGLNIVENKKTLPKNIFIEINVILLGESSDFKKKVSSPILNVLKDKSHVFRSDKQPLACIGKVAVVPLINMFIKKLTYTKENKVKPDNKQLKKRNDTKNYIFEEVLALRKEKYSQEIDKIIMNKNFELLSKYVSFLKSKDVNIIFFEMPVNEELINTKRAKYIRNRINTEYSDFNFIAQPNNVSIYKTSDGHHLTYEESIIYTEYFKKKANSLTKYK